MKILKCILKYFKCEFIYHLSNSWELKVIYTRKLRVNCNMFQYKLLFKRYLQNDKWFLALIKENLLISIVKYIILQLYWRKIQLNRFKNCILFYVWKMGRHLSPLMIFPSYLKSVSHKKETMQNRNSSPLSILHRNNFAKKKNGVCEEKNLNGMRFVAKKSH